MQFSLQWEKCRQSAVMCDGLQQAGTPVVQFGWPEAVRATASIGSMELPRIELFLPAEVTAG